MRFAWFRATVIIHDWQPHSRTGTFVMGIGKKTTPRAFVNACDLFVYTENLVPQNEPLKSTGTTANSAHKKKTAKSPNPVRLRMSKTAIHPTRCHCYGVLLTLRPVITDGLSRTLGHHLQQLTRF